MDNRWWGLQEVRCPECESASFLIEVHFSTDGQLRFLYLCSNKGCENSKKYFPLFYYASQLQAIAMGLDMDKHCEGCIRRDKPIKPPLKELPPAPAKETPEDKKFLHDLGIEDPEENNDQSAQP